jgi:hypothetical protein
MPRLYTGVSQNKVTGLRDWISRRDRKWGANVPVVDLNWVLAEYDNKEPVPLIE